MKKRLLPLIALCLAFIICLSACSGEKKTTPTDAETSAQSDTTEKTEIKGHNVFGTFTAKTVDGKEADNSIFEGKITMVNIWATYCGPCINEMPYLEKLSKEFADKGFQVVGIVSDVYLYPDGSYEPTLLSEAEKVIANTGVTYMNLLPSESLKKNKLDAVRYVPETVFLDEKGNLIGESYIGSHPYNEWKQIVESVLESAE